MRTGKVCASISAKSRDEAVSRILEAETFADLIEIRFDHLQNDELSLLLEYLRDNRIGKPLIATYRSPDQGGRGPASAKGRKEFWERLGDGFWAVDLEEDVFDVRGDLPARILSFHDLHSAGDNAREIFDRLNAHAPAVIKYAYHANDAVDTIPAWKMLAWSDEAGPPLIAIAMGEAGKITRILGPAYGSQWSYGSVGNETAPGQIPAMELKDIYRVARLNRQTRVYGVIGDPVSGSRSPRIHNAAFDHLGLNSVFVPLLVRDIGEFIKRMVAPATREVDLNFGGFAVTMPLKLSIMGYLDEIDPTASAIGAVNTIEVRQGRLHGHNTDAEGFMAPLISRLGSLKGARAAIFGAGGAARACLYALKKEGAAVTIFSRDPLKGSKLAAAFGADSEIIGSERLRSFDIIVNATPFGMNGDVEGGQLLRSEELGQTKLVYDLVTAAEPTALIRTARAADVATITGDEMLVAQAVRQFEIWTGMKAPADIMKRAAG